MIRHALALVLASALVPSARAQSCSFGQTFLKNDLLPLHLGSQADPQLLVNLCDGEAAGVVFDVTGIAPTVRLRSASIGFLQPGAVSGSPAVLNLRIYDGITWTHGGGPNLGPEVFDYRAATGNGITVTSSGGVFNSIDLSLFNIPVSSGKLVMTWWMEFNSSGTCSGGYAANFSTDYPNPGCYTQQKNLIFLTNRMPAENGWHDATTATSFTTPLCPNFFVGNWLMRGCVEPAGPNMSFCSGDGSLVTPCPCSNYGLGGQGCDNSRATGGAYLSSTGSPIPDTIVLTSAGGLPTSLHVFLQGSAEITGGLVWGDGVRCISGTVKRLYTRSAVGGIVRAPQGAEMGIRDRSGALGDWIAAGSSRYYQVAYRDGRQTFCAPPMGSAFNASNALRITW